MAWSRKLAFARDALTVDVDGFVPEMFSLLSFRFACCLGTCMLPRGFHVSCDICPPRFDR